MLYLLHLLKSYFKFDSNRKSTKQYFSGKICINGIYSCNFNASFYNNSNSNLMKKYLEKNITF